jgi:hypothetical protein
MAEPSCPAGKHFAVSGQFRVFEVVTGLLIASGSIAFHVYF